MAASIPIYQLKISLVGMKPPVWRRVLVPASIKLSKLHLVIQGSFEWHDSHLHSFTYAGIEYAPPAARDFDFGMPSEDERKVELKTLLTQEGQKLNYLYDFGDNWEHLILLEKILPPEKGVTYPKIVAGKRGAPPEDCGGNWGYEEMLEALESPDHPEHETYVDWIDEGYSPTFNLEAAQKRLSEWV